MGWDGFIKRRAAEAVFDQAWKRAQRVRAKAEKLAEKLAENFFKELVHVGINVPGPPALGRFTPHWEPLSNSWLDQKFPEDNFYFESGALERALLAKSTQNIFGRPQVDLVFQGKRLRVNANDPAKKYGGARGPFKIVLRPFPRAFGQTAEAAVARPGSETFFKLMNPRGHYFRPLVTPFLRWYVHTKMRSALA